MWILIPESALYRLDRSALGYRVLEELCKAIREHAFSPNIMTRGGFASLQSLESPRSILVAAWSTSESGTLDPIRPADEHVLSIWGGDGFTLWTLPASQTEEIFFRLIDLAYRVWTSQPFAPSWHYSKVNGTPSVFAADRTLKDVRVSYDTRVDAGLRLLEIGTLYVAHRGNGVVHTTSPSILSRVPQEWKPPPEALSGNEVSASTDDGDLVIERPAGENRHLFAMSYPAWMSSDGPLTKQQRRVIEHVLTRPLRIHGPAGSGKTLVLILKTLRLLQRAQESNAICRVLFVANSTAMRNTIRTAIDAIDDRHFLATTRNDPQFLDVETLHGWCIRELGAEIGLRYVLDEDPTVSREQQRNVLQEVTESVFADKYKKLKEHLSEDFVRLWENRPDEFVRLLGWEIAIRIKGCGLRRGKDLDAYVRSPIPSFVGRREKPSDRRMIFYVFAEYENYFSKHERLDTDDIVLSMAARLKASLWDRQRRTLGYDFVMVDEAHLFNENERRVLPYLTRGTTDFLPLILTFDEAQSIGGRRGLSSDELDLKDSDRRNLKYVHRSSPDIVALARYVRERGSLVFVEFGSLESEARMSEKELKRCEKPTVIFVQGAGLVVSTAIETCEALRAENLQRIAVICFELQFVQEVANGFSSIGRTAHEVRARGDVLAATPKAGYYLMTPELCGGLEFDAVVLLGVEEGRVPPDIADLSSEGHMSIEEDSHREIYTAVTRARFRVILVCDKDRGLSSIMRPALSRGLLVGTRSV